MMAAKKCLANIGLVVTWWMCALILLVSPA